jgi:hypothetical protein
MKEVVPFLLFVVTGPRAFFRVFRGNICYPLQRHSAVSFFGLNLPLFRLLTHGHAHRVIAVVYIHHRPGYRRGERAGQEGRGRSHLPSV